MKKGTDEKKKKTHVNVAAQSKMARKEMSLFSFIGTAIPVRHRSTKAINERTKRGSRHKGKGPCYGSRRGAEGSDDGDDGATVRAA